MPQLPDTHEESAISVVYTNYMGETALRHIVPRRLWYGATEWHPDAQWLLDALDLDKGADRTFAMKDIRCWFREPCHHVP